MARPMIEFKDADIKGLDRAIGRLARVSRRELRLMVGDVSKRFIRKAQSATPMAKKKTEWVFAQIDGETVGIQLDSPVLTPGRAFGKSGFAPAGKRLGMSSSAARGQGDGEFVDNRRKLRPSFRIINAVPYIGSLDVGGQMPPLPDPKHLPFSPAHNISKRGLAGTIVDVDRLAKTSMKREMSRAWKL